MEERLCALDVFEEFHAEPLPRRAPLDEPRNIRDDKLIVRAEMRLKRRERVARDSASRSGELVEKARFTCVGQADQSDIGNEPELELVRRAVALLAGFEFHRSRVGGRAKFEISPPANTRTRRQNALTYMLHFLLEAGDIVDDARPRRDLEYEVFARASVEELSSAVASVFGLYLLLVRVRAKHA